MPLQPIAETEVVAANKLAERIVADITQLGTRVKAIRANGIPAQAAQAAGVVNGQNVPARPATAGISAAALNAALGEDNCAVLDMLADALGL